MTPYPLTRFVQCAEEIARTVRELAQRGFVPATSGNFSMRIDAEHVAITISGRDKSRLSVTDVMVVDGHGRPVGIDARPSAETLLHLQVYRRAPVTGAVLHTHSRTQTIASRLFAAQGEIDFEGYELLKAFSGYTTHQSRLRLPVFANTQDMQQLAATVETHWEQNGPLLGYLIEGHGIYTWGRDMEEARRHLDAFEFLLECELELRRLRP